MAAAHCTDAAFQPARAGRAKKNTALHKRAQNGVFGPEKNCVAGHLPAWPVDKILPQSPIYFTSTNRPIKSSILRMLQLTKRFIRTYDSKLFRSRSGVVLGLVAPLLWHPSLLGGVGLTVPKPRRKGQSPFSETAPKMGTVPGGLRRPVSRDIIEEPILR